MPATHSIVRKNVNSAWRKLFVEYILEFWYKIRCTTIINATPIKCSVSK